MGVDDYFWLIFVLVGFVRFGFVRIRWVGVRMGGIRFFYKVFGVLVEKAGRGVFFIILRISF